MRVVAGSARGRRLVAPRGRDIRPTSDRVREAVFNSLGSLDAVEGRTVVDLFAGTGALGIEALSRGAAHATFVDHHRAAVEAVTANLAAAGLAERATVVSADAAAFLDRCRHRDQTFDLAFLDPPYAFDGWDGLLAALPAPFAVIESDHPVDPGAAWEVVRSRTYGTTVVTTARRRPSQPRSDRP